MLENLIKGIMSVIAIKLLDNYRHLSIRLLKIEAAKSYLHGVDMARTSAIGLIRICMFMALVLIGVVILHIGLFVLLPWTVKAKAVLCLILGTAYVVLGYIALRYAMDEKVWMDKSGATKMLKEASGWDCPAQGER